MNPLLKNKRSLAGRAKLAPMMRRQNQCCYYCGRKCHYNKMPYATVEHIKPLSSPEGKDRKSNRVMACHSCNSMKNNMPLDMFLEELSSLSNAIVKKEKKMEEDQKQAYLYGGMNAHEYAQSIGKHDLATFTADEWLTFCECMCKNYHAKLVEQNV